MTERSLYSGVCTEITQFPVPAKKAAARLPDNRFAGSSLFTVSISYYQYESQSFDSLVNASR